jgi:hypothetical protein
MATISPDPVNKERWFVAEKDGQAPQLGAQLAHDPNDQLTVYWSGKVSRSQVLQIIRSAVIELESGAQSPFSYPGPIGRLIAYGENMREEIPIGTHGAFLTAPSKRTAKTASALHTFTAARAVLSINPLVGPIIIWANVTGHVRGELSRGGENIGVGFPPTLFEGPVREIVVHAIEMTMHMRPDTISILLDKFAEDLLQRRRPAAG